MSRHLAIAVGLVLVGGCSPMKVSNLDRPSSDRVLEAVRKGESARAAMDDGRVLDLDGAVTAGPLICAARFEPACFPAGQVTALEVREAPRSPWWAYAVAVPFAPVVLAGMAVDEADRRLTGGPQTFSPGWAASRADANPCVRHVRREKSGAWPSDQRIRADLYGRRLALGGRCLRQLAGDSAFSPTQRRAMSLTGQVRLRFEAFACVRALPEAEAAAPRAFVPAAWDMDGREIDWPGELRTILDDADTWVVTSDLAEACRTAGGVSPDPALAIARAREGWPLPSM